jgi:6-phosphofructokinase 1
MLKHFIGHYPLGIHNGIEGLMNGDIESMSWESVNGWAPMGGALLGTKRTLPAGKFEAVSRKIREHKIQGILLVGGFEAFHSVLQLADQRDKYPEFKIPMVVLPATIR